MSLTDQMEQDAAESGELGTDANLESLRGLVEELEETEEQIEALALQAKRLSGRKEELAVDLIPTTMQAVGLSEFKTSSGKTITLQDIISGTLGEGKDETEADHAARKADAFKWLIANGHGGVIKRSLSIPMGRDFNPKIRKRIIMGLRQLGVTFDEGEFIHPSTLKSLLKELKGDGVLPDEVVRLFRASEIHRVKVTRPKKKRS